jgi:soluble lytic murein transglycosylase-like protein
MKRPDRLTNSVVLLKDHLGTIRRVKRRALKVHGVGIVLLLISLVSPYVFHLQASLVTETYRLAKGEFELTRARHRLLTLLRTKPITVGLGLDVADIILTQKEVPVAIILGLIEIESSFKAQAVSRAGARGLVQVMPIHDRGPVSITDPVANLRAGLDYLADMKRDFGTWDRALRAYNGGPKNADNPALTKYARAVMAKADQYQREMER